MSRTFVFLCFVAIIFTQTWTNIDFEKIVWLGKRFCVHILSHIHVDLGKEYIINFPGI